MEYKGYEIIARAIWRPVGHFKGQFAVCRRGSSGAQEIVYQGVIASPDYTAPAVAEAQATRAAQGWVDRETEKRPSHSTRDPRTASHEMHAPEPGEPLGFAYG